jgi:hypothetical protein
MCPWHILLDPAEIRHTCEQSDSLTSYAYTQHDGRTYSSQDLVDGKNNVKLTTKFLKVQGERSDGWVVRVRGEVIDPGKPSDNVSYNPLHYTFLDSIRYRPHRPGPYNIRFGRGQGCSADDLLLTVSVPMFVLRQDF